MMRALRIGLALAAAVGASVSAADWPQWRGPHGNGVADEKDLPLRWTATENVAWKADLGGVGVSSPIVAGNRIFVTSQIGAGIFRQGPRLAQGADAASAGERSLTPRTGERTLFLVEAFDRTAGRRLWEYRFEAATPLPVRLRTWLDPRPLLDPQGRRSRAATAEPAPPEREVARSAP